IRHGLAETVLVHAGDSRLSSGALLGYAKAHTLSHHLSPDASSLPFDRDRRGFVPGEGGAAFVLEDRSAAQKRGTRILAEITGYAATLDGGALTAPDPKGIQAEKAVRRALAMADLTPGDIDFVSAHGTGTGLNDAMEAGLLARVFPGKDGPAVTAFKSWTGHLASACGAVETALAIICAQERITPPVRGLRHPLTDSLRFVLPGTAPAPDVFKPGSCGLVENFGFGGQNAALCLRVEA
ncbi:MAG: beta-ketoacyl synthase N-terminal-like domain-containing protein, partial [Desulfovibrio sp.]